MFWWVGSTGTALAKSISDEASSDKSLGDAVDREYSPELNLRRSKMTNLHTLRFSIFAAGVLALCLPVVAAAQWGNYPDNRYPDDRYPNSRNGNYGRYDERYLKDSVHRLDRLAKDFEKDMDRALDHSRVDGTRREDQINNVVHDFRRAAGDLKSRVGNGRDLNRSANEAERVLQLADQVDRFGARRLDSRTASEWSEIQNELRTISDVYGLNYRGGYNGGRYPNNGNRNNDWWRRIPIPRY
jgi:hypothetical protein